ncbi:cysteine desulfurase-like protein [Sporosarcina ureilytica]|uniref:Cysteine desulfurase-like protein n=1 Tax=Sporosarcina ureilytica TaxID=298596 RepID=A0A1D8JJ69_9BACL|nr:cysteine desulfurase-like protein [Sporosarcina ureilytica]AOV08745.1 cysteine desulfurase-like protein [Sporosarcina ureilytica]
MYPINEIRKRFPSLTREYNGKQVAYFDGPGGSQVEKNVIEAMVSYLSKGTANLHGEFPTSMETEQHIKKARKAIADLMNAQPNEVAFGQNSTSLMLSVARGLSKTWTSANNIVVTEIDHRSNVDSWLTAAEDQNTEVRFIPVDTETLSLDLSKVADLIDENTAIVAVTLASNAVGTITDIKAITKRARQVGAIVVVDAVHAVPHYYINRDELDVDILFCSAYKFFGPHIGISVIKEDLFEKLSVYKLKPAPGFIPDKLETGTQNHEAIAAIESCVNFIASLGTGDTRSEKIQSAFSAIEEHEDKLANLLRNALADIPEVTLYQAPDNVAKTPTIAFTINGADPVDVCKWLAENHSIFIASGDFYASTLADKLGLNETGGWIRAGLAPYNTEEETTRLIEAIQLYVAKHLSYQKI